MARESIGISDDDDQLRLQAGAAVGLAVDHGRLVVDANARPRYTLDEMSAASDYNQPEAAIDRERSCESWRYLRT